MIFPVSFRSDVIYTALSKDVYREREKNKGKEIKLTISTPVSKNNFDFQSTPFNVNADCWRSISEMQCVVDCKQKAPWLKYT